MEIFFTMARPRLLTMVRFSSAVSVPLFSTILNARRALPGTMISSSASFGKITGSVWPGPIVEGSFSSATNVCKPLTPNLRRFERHGSSFVPYAVAILKAFCFNAYIHETVHFSNIKVEMAYGGEDMEMMGEFDHPIERYARVEEDAKLAETTFREINEDYIPFPEIPVTNDVDLPPNWVATDVEESGGPQTQIAVEDFKAYMRTTGKLSREPSKNLNFRYNSRTKDLEVQYPNKSGKLEWWRLTTDSNKNKFYAPSKYPKGLQVELGLLSAKPPELTAKQRQPLEVAKERIIASRSDNIDQDANVAVNALNEAVQSIGTNTDGIPMRELEAFDKGAQRTRGALADEVAKINEVKDHIASRKQKINRPDIDEATREVEVRELQKLEDELTARLEVASGHRETL